MSVAKPQASDAAVKITIDHRNTRRRPSWSLTRPAVGIEITTPSPYTVIVHPAQLMLECKLRWIAGSAVATIVASMVPINIAASAMPAIRPREDPGRDDDSCDVEVSTRFRRRCTTTPSPVADLGARALQVIQHRGEDNCKTRAYPDRVPCQRPWRCGPHSQRAAPRRSLRARTSHEPRQEGEYRGQEAEEREPAHRARPMAR